MAGGSDNPTISVLHWHCHFYRRRCGQAQIYHVDAQTYKGVHHKVLYHLARNTRVSTYYYSVRIFAALLLQPHTISCRKLHSVNRCQIIPNVSANGTAYS